MRVSNNDISFKRLIDFAVFEVFMESVDIPFDFWDDRLKLLRAILMSWLSKTVDFLCAANLMARLMSSSTKSFPNSSNIYDYI